MCVMQSAEKSLGQIDDSITLAHIQHPHGYLIMCFLRVSSAILSVKNILCQILNADLRNVYVAKSAFAFFKQTFIKC